MAGGREGRPTRGDHARGSAAGRCLRAGALPRPCRGSLQGAGPARLDHRSVRQLPPPCAADKGVDPARARRGRPQVLRPRDRRGGGGHREGPARVREARLHFPSLRRDDPTMRLLLAEDDVKLARALDRGLRRAGYGVDVAHDGDAALLNARVYDYDVAVLDVMMPGRDGVEVCRALRADSRWTPVLLLTARDQVPDRIRGLDAGADD